MQTAEVFILKQNNC